MRGDSEVVGWTGAQEVVVERGVGWGRARTWA